MNMRMFPFRYFVALVILSGSLLLLLDKLVMPWYVSSGKERFLPDLVGLPYKEAVKRLQEQGLSAEKVHAIHTEEYPPNMVFETYPKAHSRVKKGRIIQLTVTEQERIVTVPNLISRTLRSAEIEIVRAGLAIDTVLYAYNDEYGAGIVTWQSPRGDNLLRRSSGMSLMVSLGQPPLSFYVPSVVGMGLQSGRREVLDAGLEVGHIKYLYTTSYLPNTIIDQSIPGGTVLKVNRFLNLTVSTYDKSRDGKVF